MACLYWQNITQMYFESSVTYTDMLKEAYVARFVSQQFCFAFEEIYSDPGADTMVTRGTDHSEWVSHLTHCFEPPIYHGNSLQKTPIARPQQTGGIVESVIEMLRPFGRPRWTSLWTTLITFEQHGKNGQKMCFNGAGDATASYKNANRTWDRCVHYNAIKWKHFPRYWLFVRGIHRSPRSFDVFFDLRMNKRLGKQPWGWWFETASCSLWRHCNDYSTLHATNTSHTI